MNLTGNRISTEKTKKRYCECGRELEYRCKMCSECRAVSDEIRKDKARHTYSKTEKYKITNKKSNDKRLEYKRKWRLKHNENRTGN